ncbi:hypothetical protein BLX87_08830 [Bacillus sp. VT-16-64]|nr:hypothetical protein BLX87_08830 [Bacillus sp. VT-16-64]
MTVELYVEDSFLKECQANIVTMDGRFVSFNQTIFYPGGGGQPCDKGLMQQEGQAYKVVNVKLENGEIVHELDRPLQSRNSPVIMKIDWPWRFRNMRYHTLLHVIAGYIYQHYKALATSSHIEKEYARIELAFPADVIETIPFEQLEQSLKNVLAQPHDVHTTIISRKEAEKKEGAIKTVINLLPPELHKIRIVQIDNIDEQACGGTHVKNTKDIGDFSIIKIQNKGPKKKRIKVKLID